MIRLVRTHGSLIGEYNVNSTASAVELAKGDLFRAELTGRNLSCLRLYKAYMVEANLYKADLHGTSLYGAQLINADMTMCNLSGANLEAANIRGAIGILRIGPIGSEGRNLYAINHIEKIMILTGCFYGTIEQFRNAVDKKHADNQYGVSYRAMIDFIKAHAISYKWSEYSAKDKC